MDPLQNGFVETERGDAGTDGSSDAFFLLEESDAVTLAEEIVAKGEVRGPSPDESDGTTVWGLFAQGTRIKRVEAFLDRREIDGVARKAADAVSLALARMIAKNGSEFREGVRLVKGGGGFFFLPELQEGEDAYDRVARGAKSLAARSNASKATGSEIAEVLIHMGK